jgi:hypothetical protein
MPPYSACGRAPKLGLCYFTDFVRSRFPGSAGQSMAECSGTRERRTSGELTSATTRQKKSSNLMASPSDSGKNENGICCPTPMMISRSGGPEDGRKVLGHSPAKICPLNQDLRTLAEMCQSCAPAVDVVDDPIVGIVSVEVEPTQPGASTAKREAVSCKTRAILNRSHISEQTGTCCRTFSTPVRHAK